MAKHSDWRKKLCKKMHFIVYCSIIRQEHGSFVTVVMHLQEHMMLHQITYTSNSNLQPSTRLIDIWLSDPAHTCSDKQESEKSLHKVPNLLKGLSLEQMLSDKCLGDNTSQSLVSQSGIKQDSQKEWQKKKKKSYNSQGEIRPVRSSQNPNKDRNWHLRSWDCLNLQLTGVMASQGIWLSSPTGRDSF